MSSSSIHLRPATKADADHLTRFINLAGDGLPLHLWQQLAEPGQDPWEVCRQRAQRDEGGFSFRNATIATWNGTPAAALIAYPIAPPETPRNYDELPPLFRPLQELEDLAGQSFYINVVATYDRYRKRGLGTALMREAARQAKGKPLSLIVSDTNPAAIRLYQALGFVRRAARAPVKDGWHTDTNQWILMTT